MILHSNQKRSGVVLLIVLALLSLFAIVGLSFVFYADAEAVASRAYAESLVPTKADVDTEVLMAFALGQMIYDTPNEYSAVRGWSLARSLYGFNPTTLNYTPYNGVGRDALGNTPVAFGGGAVDQKYLINYQKFDATAAIPLDPLAGAIRIPEFFGKGASPTAPADPNFRYVGGANPPWTSYDINSLFLAEVMADGTVLMPSFYRPWIANGLGALAPADQLKVAKYMSLFPHPSWNPAMFPLPDADAIGDVKNLDFGPGGNDSKWMDFGFPIMTAPNGKRYKALFAPLIMDLSNRIHLIGSGNQRGGTAPGSGFHVSDQGFGLTEVNVAARAPGVSAAILPPALTGTPANTGGASDTGAGIVTINTVTPHGFKAGDQIIVAGVRGAGYNGTFTVLTAPNNNPTRLTYRLVPAPKPALARSGYGTVTNAEFAQLFNYKYNGATAPAGLPITFPMFPAPPVGRLPGGLPYSLLNFDGRGGFLPGQGEQGVSARPQYFAFATALTAPALAGAGTTVGNPIRAVTYGQTYGGFHWSIYPGMSLIFEPGTPNQELRTVATVNYVDQTFTISAALTKPHLVGVPIVFGVPTKGTPYFPPGYDNVDPNLEIIGNPLGLQVTNKDVAGMEALLRYQQTNGPAITSDIFRLMPKTFNNIRNRGIYTTLNWKLDRIGSSPTLTFDHTTPNNFVFNAATKYPRLAAFPPAAAQYGVPTPLPNSDFTGDWRSVLSQRLRVDLNRLLTEYPVGVITLPNAQYTKAVTERNLFATDIYNALVRATGARDPNVVAGMVATSPDYQAARWLAQLAANIVDYIDADDYCTPFRWYPGAAAPADQWVFGTELPRLVLNEVYAQQEPEQATQNSQLNRVNVWAEMYNPFSASPLANTYPTDGGAATLTGQQTPPYMIEIHRSSAPLTAWLRDPANAKGDGVANPVANQFSWSGAPATPVTQSVQPSNGVSSAGVVTLAIAPDNANPALAGVSLNGVTATVNLAPGQTIPFGIVAGQAVTISGVTGGPVGAANSANYEGCFVILTINNARTSFTFNYGLPGAPPTAGGGTATFVVNANAGFYVIAPVSGQQGSGATFSSAARNPQLPATFASPGMGFLFPSLPILPKTADPLTTGATNDGTAAAPADKVVTIRIGTVVNGVTQPQAHGFAVGDTVVIDNVVPNPAPGFNGTFQITSVGGPLVNGQPSSFTYNISKGMPPPALTAGSNPGGNRIATATPMVPNVTLLLRRLANPRLPFNPTPTNANYNPYITVDYVDSVPVTPPSSAAPGAPPVPVANYTTFGRMQPYAASPFKMRPQNSVTPNQPQNTFFQRNSLIEQFEWLTHLDRPLINPLELLHISGYKQHELTQQFVSPISATIASNGATQAGNVVTITTNAPHGLVTGQSVFIWGVMTSGYNGGAFTVTVPNVPNATTFTYTAAVGGLPPSGGGTVSLTTTSVFRHYAPWADQTTLLYRSLELFGTANHMAGNYNGGRQTGGPNINTITEPEVLMALADAQDATQPNPLFRTYPNAAFPGDKYIYNPANPGDPNALFTKLVASRNNGVASLAPTSDGKPFKPLCAGNIGDTVFRPDPLNPGVPLFSIGAGTDHPYLQAALMQKIYNNMTTTSNCFAVWMTVGFFEVVDESVKPARLGPEIGRDQNRHVRHRFFAIIDRSAMELCRGTAQTGVNVNINNPLPQTLTMRCNAASISSMGGTTAAWSNAKNYLPGDTVTFVGISYICIQANRARQPATNAAFWQRAIQPGMQVEIVGGTPEVVTVKTVGAGNTFTADFMFTHPAGSQIIVRGNPGPQAVYNPRKDSNVVLHLSVIQ